MRILLALRAVVMRTALGTETEYPYQHHNHHISPLPSLPVGCVNIHLHILQLHTRSRRLRTQQYADGDDGSDGESDGGEEAEDILDAHK